jgi:proteasome accessory factor C
MPINSRLARLIDLVPYISQHQGVAISNLAEKFGVSTAEIEKDLWLLYMCGLPGHTPLELMEFEFEDGFVTVRNAEELKHPRSLTQSEIAALLIGLQLLSTDKNEIADKLKFKLVNLLSSKISYTPANEDLLPKKIETALQSNKTLMIKYNGKEREIIPIEIYRDAGELYLKAHCKLANDRRTFRISRIDSLQILENTELAPNEVPTQSHKYTAKIIVHSDARRVRECLGGTSEIQFFSKEWLISQVMSLGGAVELSDPDLRAQIFAKIKASQAIYL